MDDQELQILNCIMYDPSLKSAEGQTLEYWADHFDMDAYMKTADVKTEGETPYCQGGMTADQMRNIIATVKNDPVLRDSVIQDVTLRLDRPTVHNDKTDTDLGGSAGNMATITSGKSIVVAYQGTNSPPEWVDDFQAGLPGVTDTPDQKMALDYFNRMMSQYGAGYPDVVTTGHSKGGNMAAYVAIVTGRVDRTVSINGQGFSPQFFVKYRAQIAASRGKVMTYAEVLDLVNTLLFPVGTTTYISGPLQANLPFFINHSPYSQLWTGSDLWILSNTETGIDQPVHTRPTEAQDPGIAAANAMMDYLLRYITADELALLVGLGTDVKTGKPYLDSVFDMDKLAEAKQDDIDLVTEAGLFSIFGSFVGALLAPGVPVSVAMDQVQDAMKEPYKSMFAHLMELLGGYYRGNDKNDASLKAIEALFGNFMPGPFADYLGNGLGDYLSGLPSVPYYPFPRDFTDWVKQQLLTLVDQVTPGLRLDHYGVGMLECPDLGSPLGEIYCEAEEASRRNYYMKWFADMDVSRQQIEAIFTAVETTDTTYGTTMTGIKDSIVLARQSIDVLARSIRSAGSSG